MKFFPMNGNIFNHPPASEQYMGMLRIWMFYMQRICNTTKPTSIYNNRRTNIWQSYINAYNTAFNQPRNRQRALYNYQYFNPNDIYVSFIPGTFGYKEIYNTLSQPFYINYLQDDMSVYVGTPYLFISAGSGGGSGFMYLNWIIVTYGVPYIVNVS